MVYQAADKASTDGVLSSPVDTPRTHGTNVQERRQRLQYDCDCGEDTALTQPGLELDPLKVRALTMD